MSESGRRRPSAFAVRLITGTVLVAGWSLYAIASSRPTEIAVDAPPPAVLAVAAHDVETALLARSGDECVTAQAFETAMRPRLIEIDLADWGTTRSPGIDDDSCVGFGIVSARSTILLVAALPGSLRAGLEQVANESYTECFTKEEATKRVEAVVQASSLREWEIRHDAPVGGPLDRLDEIVEHVKAGCWVYSGTGMSAEGRRLLFVVGT